MDAKIVKSVVPTRMNKYNPANSVIGWYAIPTWTRKVSGRVGGSKKSA